MISEKDLNIVQSADDTSTYFIMLKDINKTFKTKDSYQPQLQITAENENDAFLVFKDLLSSNSLTIVNDKLLEPMEEPELRPLRVGDFVGYKIGESEQELTYLIVLEDGNPLLGTPIKCYDPWFDAYVLIPVGAVWIMTNREMEMSANHKIYGMTIIGDTMINEAERVLNSYWKTQKFNAVK